MNNQQRLKIKIRNKYAKIFGTYFGLIFVLKFFLLILGFKVPSVSILFTVLVFSIPFIGYFLLKKYRDHHTQGYIGFWHAYSFSVFMYMFASLFVAIFHLVYFEFFDNGYLINTYTSIIESLVQEDNPLIAQNQTAVKELLNEIALLKPIDITMNLLSAHFIWGVILSLPSALVAMNNSKLPPINKLS